VKIASLPRIPRKNASEHTSSTSVTAPTSGPFSKLALAVGARFNPINATIAPVTAGGSTMSSHRVPTRCTARPTRTSDAPTAISPPSALLWPLLATAAVTGAITEKLDPR
jgi:hypothetical protein